MKAHPVKFSVAALVLACTAPTGCGVKSAPTPVLPSPPGPLQREAEKRALQKKEKEKEKEKSAGTEKSSK
ncbi:MAG: hypothetical protein RI932_200 [Pseudomonadota bacterium]|jgi:hypothetical protein